MATATKQSKTTVTVTGVALDLTVEEAIALRDALGRRSSTGMTPEQYKGVRLTDGIYFALKDAVGY